MKLSAIKLGWITLFVALVTTILTAEASGPGGSDSCGLGWQVTSRKSFAATSTRATTNAVIHPSFGMTSGTMGCDAHSIVKNDQKAVLFAKENYDSLSEEMAQGSGEFLATFNETLGCTSNMGALLDIELRNNYQQLVAPAKDGTELYQNVRNMLEQHPVLAGQCVPSSS